jgi:COPI associated protein
MKEQTSAIDWTVGVFNIIFGLLCLAAAAGNIYLYGASLRIIALAVFFVISGILFIILEFVQAAKFIQKQASHLNSYHGRAFHYFILSILSSESVTIHNRQYKQFIWLWAITIAMTSFAIAYAMMAIVSAFTQYLPLPKSMDFERAQEEGNTLPENTRRRSDGRHEYQTALPQRRYHRTNLSVYSNGSVLDSEADRSDFQVRPLSFISQQGGQTPDRVDQMYEKHESFKFPHSLHSPSTSLSHMEDYQNAYPASTSNHTLIDMHNNVPSTSTLAKIDTQTRRSRDSKRTSSACQNNESTPKIGGLQRIRNAKRHSAAHSISSLRYETFTDRSNGSEGSDQGKHASGVSAYHREISYDDAIGHESEQDDEHAPLPLSKDSNYKRRIFVPSVGAAIDLSSGSESEGSEEEGEDDDDDDESIYSMPSGISPADDFKQHVMPEQSTTDSQLGRRLSRAESRSVRRKLKRGIQRALTQGKHGQ